MIYIHLVPILGNETSGVVKRIIELDFRFFSPIRKPISDLRFRAACLLQEGILLLFCLPGTAVVVENPTFECVLALRAVFYPLPFQSLGLVARALWRGGLQASSFGT